MNEPASGFTTPGLRESLPVSDELYHALRRAHRVYLLLWAEEEAPHRLVVTAIESSEERAFPSNYGGVPALLLLPPSGERLPEDPSPS